MITRLSPAKINLYLRVLGKRRDGYHDILSLLQRVSLYDELDFSPGGGRIVVRCPGGALPEDEGNIVYRAAAAFFSRTAALPGIEITVRKKIPLAAGLGGGSSNAATTLLTLNELAGSPLNREGLMEIGSRLGADVPFFIFGKTAWASGIGDHLAEAPPLPPLWFVLINPGFEISTKMVYEKLNLGLTKDGINYSIPQFYTVGDLIRGLRNDLEQVTVGLHPVLDRLKVLLLENGALGALMSGSGPTVFGVFADEESAFATEEKLKQESGWPVLGARSL